MPRLLTPELLDSLPADAPAALHSRRDLRLFNRLLASEAWFHQVLRDRVRPGERILEIGAGGGELALSLHAAGLPVDALDRCPPPAHWPATAHWHQTDLFDFDRWEDYPVVLANLVLHHFSVDQLALLGAHFQTLARLLIALETRRRPLNQWLFAAVCRAIRAHPVSRHDGWASFAAGFRADELPRWLNLPPSTWQWTTTETFFGSYRLIAERRS